MLRKRSRPVPNQSKGHLMPDSASDSFFFFSDAVAPKARTTSFFSVPGLFVGLCAKGLSDSESASSPTSPLECRTPRSPGLEGHSRSWDCSRVGLGLVDSLSDETRSCGRVLGFSEGKSILFGSQMRINNPSPKTHLDRLRDDPLGAAPKSLPKDYGIPTQTHIGSPNFRSGCSKVALGSGGGAELEPGEFGKLHSSSADISIPSSPLSRLMYHNLKPESEVFSSESKNSQSESPLVGGGKHFDNFPGSLPIAVSPSDGVLGSLSASEIELSEDYTCIITHGPNPKTTHIFGNCILESHIIQSPDRKNSIGERGGSLSLDTCSDDSPRPCSEEFLICCFSCKKKLEGKDMYIYRGERAFCSNNCRDRGILTEEGTEKPTTDSSDSIGSSSNEEERFLAGMVVTV